MLKLNYQLLTKAQQHVLLQLKPFAKSGVLGGGTALMLQISHRRSYDFDIFLSKPISKQFIFKVKKVFQKIELVVDTSDELSFIVKPQNVKVSFIFYPFKPVYKVLPGGFLPIFDLRDIAIDKAYTIGRRGAWRDYVDLYFILKEQKISLKTIMQNAQRKFGDYFSKKLFLSQLNYFADVNDYTVDFFGKVIAPPTIKNFFAKTTKEQY